LIVALKQRDRFTREEILPQAVAKVLQWKQEAIYLLQLRHNYLPVLVVSRMTDIQDEGGLGRLWRLGKSWIGVRQQVDLDGFDPEELREWTLWLERATETREFLAALNIP